MNTPETIIVTTLILIPSYLTIGAAMLLVAVYVAMRRENKNSACNA